MERHIGRRVIADIGSQYNVPLNMLVQILMKGENFKSQFTHVFTSLIDFRILISEIK